ncbi:MAG: VTT domain-containing protein [Usitatibacter sp.]
MDASRRKKLIIAAAVVLAIAVGMSLAWRHTGLRDIVTVENTVDAIETISGTWWAPILIALLYTPASLIMFPRPLLTLASAVAFGPWKGFAVAMAGIITSAFLLYSAGRQVNKKTVSKIAGPRIERLSKMLAKKGFLAIAAVGMVPAAPFSVEMIVAGALRIPLLDLLLGVAIAHLPGTIGTTVLGDQVVAALSQGREINRGVIAAVVIGFVAIAFFSHRMWKRMETAG